MAYVCRDRLGAREHLRVGELDHLGGAMVLGEHLTEKAGGAAKVEVKVVVARVVVRVAVAVTAEAEAAHLHEHIWISGWHR